MLTSGGEPNADMADKEINPCPLKKLCANVLFVTDNCDVSIVSDDIKNRAHKDIFLPSVPSSK